MEAARRSARLNMEASEDHAEGWSEAMELQIARKGHFVPFVSVETPWGDPFLWQGWYHFTKDGDMFGKTGCTCKRLEPPKGYPRHCKCDNTNGYT